MSGEQQDQQEQPRPSQILVTFVTFGSSEFDLRMQGVSPNQLLVLSEWLKWKGHQLLDKVEERREMNQIAVPNMGLPDVRGKLS